MKTTLSTYLSSRPKLVLVPASPSPQAPTKSRAKARKRRKESRYDTHS